MLIPNSCSISATMSVNAKESRYPDSNSDSSGSGATSFFDTLCTISTIFCCLLILCPHLLLKRVSYQTADHAVAFAGHVNEIALSVARRVPELHRPRPTHMFPPVPEGRVLFAREL